MKKRKKETKVNLDLKQPVQLVLQPYVDDEDTDYLRLQIMEPAEKKDPQ